MEYFIQGILSFIKRFLKSLEIFYSTLRMLCILLTPDPEKRKKETTINRQPLSILIKELIINNIQFSPRFFH